MRYLGIIFILVLFGFSLWSASETYQPVLMESPPGETTPELLTENPVVASEEEPGPEPVTDTLQQPVEPSQADPPVESTGLEPAAIAVKTRQKQQATVEKVKSFNQVIIPSLKLKASVVSQPYSEFSWDLTALGHDVAQLGDIPNQTLENNIVMAGHVTVRNGSNGPFRYLWKLEPGDQILLEDGELSYTYEVREQLLVYPDQIEVLEDSATPKLTLITCTTWDEESLSYLRRRVIIADLVSVEAQHLLVD